MEMQKELHIVTTDIINKVTEKIAKGNKLISDAKEELNIKLWYDNEEGIRNVGIPFAFTTFELEEYAKCKNDIFYFAETYCKFKKYDGTISEIKLRDYQKEIIDMYVNNRFSILASARQMGKTISADIVILHFCLFNENKTVAIFDTNSYSLKDIMSKIISIYKLLPFFIKQGITIYNDSNIRFENGSKIISRQYTNKKDNYVDVDLFYLANFANIKQNIVKYFYDSIIPDIMTSNDSRLIITSTPNGNNLFYKLLEDSERDENDIEKNVFKSMRIYYDAIKERKDTILRPLYGIRNIEPYIVEFIDELKKLYGYDIIKKEKHGYLENIYIIKNDDKKETQLDFVKNIEISGKRIDSLFNVTNWKYEEMKLIGSEKDFKREYELNFEI